MTTASERDEASQTETYRETVRRLAMAQKSPKGGQLYSVYVNRRFGRLLAGAAYQAGLTPNGVTAISATFTFTGIAIIALVSSWPAAIAGPLLAIGFALDSADGQLARLRGGGSLAGEWLDHMVDAGKNVALHLAVLMHLYRFTDLSAGWLLVPMGYTLVMVLMFYAWLLNEQLARNRGFVKQLAIDASSNRATLALAFVKLPLDYGLLCWVFVLLPVPTAFMVVYAFLFVANAAYLSLALVKWYRDMRAVDLQAVASSA